MTPEAKGLYLPMLCCRLFEEATAGLWQEGIQLRYARVCTRSTIPYDRGREDETQPSAGRMCAAAARLVREG